jgi:DNA-binding transcriptional ArsR family regulator
VTYVDPAGVTAARKALHNAHTLAGLSATFKMLGDESRLKICLALANRELCVGDIAGLLGVSDSAVSHQLRLLRAMRLVRYRRDGRMTYYMLDDEHIEQLIRLGVRHVGEERR